VSEALSPERLRILVADDNVEGALLLRALLSQRGHEVAVANSGEDAVRVASEFLPQVGLLDIGMPGMNGYALAELLRHHPDHSSMFLVAVTGWGQDEDRRKAIDAGFDAHVTKPADPDELNALLAGRFPLANGSDRPL
jgi:CheY-like chemotaxis protein